MLLRFLAVGATLALVALAVFHGAPHPVVEIAADSPSPRPSGTRHDRHAGLHVSGAVVYVVGAVNRPGLYHIAEGQRADDAVRAAGGMRRDADPAGINLAAFARDGDEIDVPMLGQPISRLAQHRVRAPRVSKSATADIVDVNTADARQLGSVPGIGVAIAERIVAVRERDGAFETYDQLLDVAGMTQSRLDRAEPFLRL